MPREGERREGERAEKDDFAEYARELRKKYGELGEGGRKPRHEEETEGTQTPEREADDDKPEAEEEQRGSNDFKSYAKYLREKYADFEVEKEEGERKERDEGAPAPLERKGLDESDNRDSFATLARYLREKYPDFGTAEADQGEGGDKREREASSGTGRDQELERLRKQVGGERDEDEAAEKQYRLGREGAGPGRGLAEGPRRSDLNESKTPGERSGRESEMAQKEPDEKQHGEGEAVFIRDVVPVAERLAREASRKSLDHNPVDSADLAVSIKTSEVGDGGGAHRPEANKVPKDEMDVRAVSEDLNVLRKLQSDGTLPEATEPGPAVGRREARPEDTPAITTGVNSRGLKEDFSEGWGTDGLYRKEIVDLDKVTEPNQGGKDTRFVESDVVHGESDSRPYVRYARKGPFEVGDSIPVKANLTGVPPVIRLDVLKSHIESATGVEIDRNRLYEIKGSVKGAYDFDIYRTVGKYVYLIPNLEQRDKVKPGRVYDVSIKSVVEVQLTDAQREILGGPKKRGAWRSTMYKINHAVAKEDGVRATRTGDEVKEIQTKRLPSIPPEKIENINATFISKAWLHKWNEPRRQFNLDGPEFERKTGVSLEEMRDYVIKGSIDGVGEFQKTLHRCVAGQHIPIYVPARLQDKIETGRSYQITINSIEMLPPRQKLREMSEEAAGIRWTWKEVASWVDTEGWIGAGLERGGRYSVSVCQKERKVLEGLGKFLESEGIDARLRLDKPNGVYKVDVDTVEQAAQVVKNIEPFIRTVRKKEEIAKFKQTVARPRKTLWPGIRIARKILDLAPDGDEVSGT